jgi:secondary thiamine-phosphate synthase enzyme
VTLRQQHDTVHVSTRRGLNDVTVDVTARLRASGLRDGLCTLFIRHTSASLVIQENADPTARRDLERWLNRLVPEGDPFYTHDAEGPDDMPCLEQKLALGTWQGIYLWEHRRRGSRRELVVHIGP